MDLSKQYEDNFIRQHKQDKLNLGLVLNNRQVLTVRETLEGLKISLEDVGSYIEEEFKGEYDYLNQLKDKKFQEILEVTEINSIEYALPEPGFEYYEHEATIFFKNGTEIQLRDGNLHLNQTENTFVLKW